MRPISRENVEDACAHAWVEFLRHQPDRDHGRWKGWLYVTAMREAWKLNALEFKERADIRQDDVADVDLVDPHDRLSGRLEFQAALQELRKLPPLLQEVVVVRSQVSRQKDVAELRDLSPQRVAVLLVNAALRVRGCAGTADAATGVGAPG